MIPVQCDFAKIAFDNFDKTPYIQSMVFDKS